MKTVRTPTKMSAFVPFPPWKHIFFSIPMAYWEKTFPHRLPQHVFLFCAYGWNSEAPRARPLVHTKTKTKTFFCAFSLLSLSTHCITHRRNRIVHRAKERSKKKFFFCSGKILRINEQLRGKRQNFNRQIWAESGRYEPSIELWVENFVGVVGSSCFQVARSRGEEKNFFFLG